MRAAIAERLLLVLRLVKPVIRKNTIFYKLVAYDLHSLYRCKSLMSVSAEGM